MGILLKIKDLVRLSDFFYTSKMLRFEDEMEYRTLTGGLISLAIIITIIIGFANMILDTLGLNSITTTMQVIKQQDPTLATLSTTPDSNFMFAVEISGLNLSDSLRFFDLTFRADLQRRGVIYQTTYLPLQTCTRQHWDHFPEVSQNFDKMKSGTWLCPPINSSYALYGKYSSQDYSQHTLQVSACKNSTDPSRPCASFEEIQKKFFERQSFFYFTFYFTNPLINPGQKDYKSFYLEDESYAIFGDNLGSETILYFTDYAINTDYSIWPFEDIVQDKGCIVENLAVNHPFQTNINGSYITFTLAKSSNSIIYSRQVQKISSVFSFMGGMIGAVSAVLFVIKVYTSVAFEISIALEIFQPSQQSIVKKQNLSMNFWSFIKLSIFKLSQILGKPCDWPTMSYVDECQRQILKQLDIKALIKRIIFIEYCLTYLFEDYQLDGLQLKKPRSPYQIRKIRQKCESVLSIDSQKDCYNKQISQEAQSSVQSFRQNVGLTVIENKTGSIFHSSISHSNQNNLKEQNSSNSNSAINIIKAQTMNSRCNDLIIVDLISDINSEKVQPSNANIASNIAGKTPFSYRRQSLLHVLHQNAAEGNSISHKIWKSLEKSLKIKIGEGDKLS